ncbi:MAG: hypothetical protein IT378_11875 [Sandaracinaceae bacterium]|nr:hypothetical protein [Sandaracinaceae bacterium]
MKRILMTLSFLALAAACGGEEAAASSGGGGGGATAEPAAGGGGGGGGGGVCGRAADCCRAYVQAMGGVAAMAAVEASCGNYSNMPAGSDTGCQAAIDGWRSGLTAMSREVPSACQ